MISKNLPILVTFALLAGCATLPQPKTDLTTESKTTQTKEKTMILIETSKGNITVELNKEKAPKTVENFLKYVQSGHYDGTIFHRVINNFMIQGGGFDTEMNQKPATDTVINEADNGLSNETGTLAMARTADPNSAGAQFFINVKDNTFLDHKDKSVQGWGYCVFGKVTDGMDVVNSIKTVQTGNYKMFQDVPNDPIVIQKITILEK